MLSLLSTSIRKIEFSFKSST